MADQLVLHYRDTNILLGSRQRLNRAIAASAAVLAVAAAARALAGDSALGELALVVAAGSALALVIWTYGRLRFANAGVFLAGGSIGVMGTLGGRKGVEVSRVDHLQRGTLAVPSTRPYAVLLFIDREGHALLRLNTADLLPAEGLEELSRLSGLPLEGSWDDRYTAAEMARRFPGSMARGTRVSAGMLEHRVRTQVITAAVTFLLCVVVGLVVFAFASR